MHAHFVKHGFISSSLMSFVLFCFVLFCRLFLFLCLSVFCILYCIVFLSVPIFIRIDYLHFIKINAINMSAPPSILISELMHRDIDGHARTYAHILPNAIMYLNNRIFGLEKKVTNGSRNFIGVRKKCQLSCHVIFVFLPLSPSALAQSNIFFGSRPLKICWIHLNLLNIESPNEKKTVWLDGAERQKKSITTRNLCICWRFKYTFNRFISNSSFKCCSFQWDLYLNERREIKLRSTSGMQWLNTQSNICQISWLNWTDGLDRIASR